MTELTLGRAQAVVSGALSFAREKSLAPMTVVVLDARGALKAFAAEDGTPLRRAASWFRTSRNERSVR